LIGNGILDLVVANNGSMTAAIPGTVSVLLGNGDGTFKAATSFTLGMQPNAVAIADFNHDGHPDLAVTDKMTGTVNITLGNGDGTFQAPQSFNVGFNPQSVAVGDLNGDGTLDLVVANNDGTVSVLLGNGDGTFKAAGSNAAGLLPTAVAIGDFNRDGKADLVVANSLSNTVSVLLGNGDGTFQAAQSYAVGIGPASVAIADFNGDNFPDVVVANNIPRANGTATVLLNAADWGGGNAAALPRPSSVPLTVEGSPRIEVLAGLLAAVQPQALQASEFQADAAPQWQLAVDSWQPVESNAAFSTPTSLAIRHAQDSVFENWGDWVLDARAWIS
jgi:hypothetical protein